jgi:hypothetical protein
MNQHRRMLRREEMKKRTVQIITAVIIALTGLGSANAAEQTTHEKRT